MHQSVLLPESIEALGLRPEGIYIDGTFGRGGHSQAILDRLGPKGRLIAIDKDPEAIAFAQQQFADDLRFSIHQGSFADIQSCCEQLDVVEKVDGILLDLGVSSPQLDQAARGFSFMQDGPLDMRMDPTVGLSVAEWLTTADEAELANILWRYGEERFSRRIAKKVLECQSKQPITTTLELANIIADAVPRKEKHKHPATRSFQALRIFINRELDDLEKFLKDFDVVLAPEGHVAVISFHSLEDRMVKLSFREKVQGPELPRHIPIVAEQAPRYHWVAKKMKPTDNEQRANVRSRSATLRAIAKNWIASS